MSRFKIPESEYENIIEMYKNGYSRRQIGEKYGASPSTIFNVLVKFGLTKSKPDRLEKYKDEMIDLYNNGYTLDQIGNIYNVSHTAISNRFDKWNIERRHRTYTLDETYFDSIDTPDKAYILGLLYADGYNQTQAHYVDIVLQKKDSDILNKIKECIKTDRPLYPVNRSEKNPVWQDCLCLRINSKHISETLDKYGMMRAKSLILEFPKQLDEKLFFDFLRGYYDGDGSIYDARGCCQISIVGTQNFCEYVQQILLEKYNIETIVDYCYNKEKSTRNLRIYKQKDVIPFLYYIYKDAHLYLKRKHDIYISKYCNNDINNTLINVAS